MNIGERQKVNYLGGPARGRKRWATSKPRWVVKCNVHEDWKEYADSGS